MRYPGRVQRQIDPDDIEAARKRMPVAFLQETMGGPGDMTLFSSVDPGLRIAEPPAGSGLDFHEDKFFAVPGDEVYFTTGDGIPVVSGQNGMALPAQEDFRDGLAS